MTASTATTSLALSVFFQGLALSLGLIVAIGAQNAFVLRQGLRREHVGPIVAVCALCDAVLMAAGVAGLAQLLGTRPGLATVLTLAGMLFLTAYGLMALRRALRPGTLQAAAANAAPTPLRTVLLQALGFTLLNPHVYLDTVLLLGSLGAQQPGAAKGAFVAAAATASLVWFTALGHGARWLAPVFARPRAWQVLDVLIGVTMFFLSALLVRHALAHA
jgi:L-lysine exporter family protein LysE/ArgO